MNLVLCRNHLSAGRRFYASSVFTLDYSAVTGKELLQVLIYKQGFDLQALNYIAIVSLAC